MKPQNSVTNSVSDMKKQVVLNALIGHVMELAQGGIYDYMI